MYDSLQARRPQFSAYPPAIKLIISSCLAVFLLQGMMPGVLESVFALWPLGTPELVRTPYGVVQIPQFHIWQLFTYSLLHGGLAHIFFNLFALWMFGAQVENIWGSQRFLTYYVVCVIGAGLVQLLVVTLSVAEGQPPIPTVGASGGVFGVLLAFAWMFPEARIMLLIPPIPLKAKVFVPLYAAVELYFGVTGTQSGVAHFAHLGGLFFGWLLIQYWRGRLYWKPQRRFYW